MEKVFVVVNCCEGEPSDVCGSMLTAVDRTISRMKDEAPEVWNEILSEYDSEEDLRTDLFNGLDVFQDYFEIVPFTVED